MKNSSVSIQDRQEAILNSSRCGNGGIRVGDIVKHGFMWCRIAIVLQIRANGHFLLCNLETFSHQEVHFSKCEIVKRIEDGKVNLKEISLCPLCNSPLKYIQKIIRGYEVEAYICKETCPFVGFEYIDDTNLIALIELLRGDEDS